jgi:hypothetical protein
MQTITHDNKEIKVMLNGKVVVVAPLNHNKVIVPFHCPMCEYPMKTADDAQSYRDYQCCSMCELYWARSGIQPEKDSERWKLFMERRHMAFLPQIQFK